MLYHNLPSKAYAVKQAKPRLHREVEGTLSNKHEELIHIRAEDTTIDTYYIHSKRTYYQGNWMGGLPHGKGNAIYPDGTFYYGKYDNGQAEDSHAFLIFPNGAFYEGEVHNSKMHGKGKLIHKRIYKYEGEWSNNRPDGKGHEHFYEDGSEYIGLFRNGLKHCYDESTSIRQKKEKPPKLMSVYRRNNDIYRGQFKNGLMHGYGELTNKTKNTAYEGEFVNGKKEGYGTLRTQQGRLTGHFHDDLINGQGIFQWLDGRRYEGEFKDSRFHGEGTITYPEGNSMVGQWEQGQNKQMRAIYGGKLEESQYKNLDETGSRRREQYNRGPPRQEDYNENNRQSYNNGEPNFYKKQSNKIKESSLSRKSSDHFSREGDGYKEEEPSEAFSRDSKGMRKKSSNRKKESSLSRGQESPNRNQQYGATYESNVSYGYA